MATWTIPSSNDNQNGPLDPRVYFTDGSKIHGVSHPAGDVSLVQGSGVAATVNPMKFRTDVNDYPVDERTITYDGQKPHYFDAFELGEQPQPTGVMIDVSRF